MTTGQKAPIVAKGNGSVLIAQCTICFILAWVAIVWGVVSFEIHTMAAIPEGIEKLLYPLFACLTAVSGIGKYFPKEK
jgi:hypothetical protein